MVQLSDEDSDIVSLVQQVRFRRMQFGFQNHGRLSCDVVLIATFWN